MDRLKRIGGGREPLLHPLARVATATVLLTLVACGETPQKPKARPALADGSPSQPVPHELSGLGTASVLTRVHTVTSTNLNRRDRLCIHSEAGRPLGPGDVAVERLDALGSSLTFRPRGGRFVYGCIAGGRNPIAEASWCGHVAGEVRHDRLVDPRLDIGCHTSSGAAPIGSAWIDPVPGARWIVVRDRMRIQIYPTAASLPIRITTTAVDIETATALFRLEQYDGSGARIAEATLRTAVAG